MVKHTQTIRRQQPTNCLSVLTILFGWSLKGYFPNIIAVIGCDFQKKIISLSITNRTIVDKKKHSLFKLNNRNTRKGCEICSKLTIKTPERRIASFEHISDFFSRAYTADFKQVNVRWVVQYKNLLFLSLQDVSWS